MECIHSLHLLLYPIGFEFEWLQTDVGVFLFTGKVITRSFYEKNKHIFPYSRYEVYDPNKEYSRYTIHGSEVNQKKK